MMRVRSSTPLRGAIFDLDGVLVDTAALHHQAWREVAGEFGLDVTASINERLKGVARDDALGILLDLAGVTLSDDERAGVAARKNARYVQLLATLGPQSVLPGVRALLRGLRAAGIGLAVGSASRNAPLVIERLEIASLLDVVVDGSMVARTKPDPEVFLLAARRLNLEPQECLVFEDAEAGLQAARSAGMLAVGVGRPDDLPSADLVIGSLAELDPATLFTMPSGPQR